MCIGCLRYPRSTICAVFYTFPMVDFHIPFLSKWSASLWRHLLQPPVALRLSSCFCSAFCFTPMISERPWDFTGVAHLLQCGLWLIMWPVLGSVAVTLRRPCASLLAEGEWSPPVCCSATWSQCQQSSADVSQCDCGFFIVLGSSLPDIFWLCFRWMHIKNSRQLIERLAQGQHGGTCL